MASTNYVVPGVLGGNATDRLLGSHMAVYSNRYIGMSAYESALYQRAMRGQGIPNHQVDALRYSIPAARPVPKKASSALEILQEKTDKWLKGVNLP